jgi:feruloyl esterase
MEFNRSTTVEASPREVAGRNVIMKRSNLFGCCATLIALLATALSPARAAFAATCGPLNNTFIPPSSIGLPTTGADVTTTTVAATPAMGEYCKASVAIHPVDKAAPDILAQVNLPATWNGKAFMQGGGGYDGSIPNTTVNFGNGPVDKPAPLAQGYATFSSNSGHRGNGLGSQDGSFALNAEALHNFAGDALKKTRDAAIYLIVQHYGSAPSRSYFVGGSSGGREALWVVQNTPQDFDGAVAMYPAWNAASLDLQFGRITRAMAGNGAYPNAKKQLLWVKAVIAACDELDDLADGLVSNVAACHFDPQTVRCPGGADTGDTCFSDAQIAAVSVYGTPLFIPYETGSGESFYPGFNVFVGADLTGGLDLNSQQPTSDLMTSDQAAAAACTPSATQACPYKAMPYFSVFWDQWAKYFVTGNPRFDSLTLDPQNPGPYRERISDLLGLQDVNKTDLSAFQERRGKLILMHGLADGLVATDATTDYYLRVIGEMGAKNARSFVRYYTIPGLGHVFGSPRTAGGGFFAGWDPLAALEAWVEKGKEPSGLVTTDQNTATRGRTRPVCEWPSWPKYNGAGDPNSASSFACARSAGDDGEKAGESAD